MNNLPKVVAQQRRGRASNLRLLDCKSDALPLSHRCSNYMAALHDDHPFVVPRASYRSLHMCKKSTDMTVRKPEISAEHARRKFLASADNWSRTCNVCHATGKQFLAGNFLA